MQKIMTTCVSLHTINDEQALNEEFI
jgi:hypothetical protein